MKTVTIMIADYLYDYYKKQGERAGSLSPERAMAESLLRQAREHPLNPPDANGAHGK